MNPIKIGIVDYGMGNLLSVRNAFEQLGCEVTVSNIPDVLLNSDGVVLPGVGAFGEAMSNLRALKLVDPMRMFALANNKPVLGICLGMQLLSDRSNERGSHEGLSLIPGHVTPIPTILDLRLPHIGWNELSINTTCPLFKGLENKSAYYFVHSYRMECDPKYIAATSDYGIEFIAAVQRDNIFGVQFHPERSQRKGLRLLNNFIKYVERSRSNRED